MRGIVETLPICRDPEWCGLDTACAPAGDCKCMTECTAFLGCYHLCAVQPAGPRMPPPCTDAAIEAEACKCTDDCIARSKARPQARIPVCTSACHGAESELAFLTCVNRCLTQPAGGGEAQPCGNASAVAMATGRGT